MWSWLVIMCTECSIIELQQPDRIYIMCKTSIVCYLCMPATGGNYIAEDLTWTNSKRFTLETGMQCRYRYMQIKRTNNDSSLMFDVLLTRQCLQRDKQI